MAAFEKVRNGANIQMRPFLRADVQAVDKLIELAKGYRDVVKSEEDWRLVEIIFQFFMQRWPKEFHEFYSAIPSIRSTRRDKGYSKSKEIKYVGALPYRFERLVKVIFPYQAFDKKFANKLVKRIPLLKVGGA
jgi:hypothetical protein